MKRWLRLTATAAVGAFLALSTIVIFNPAFAQQAQRFLANALHLDGATGDTDNDRFLGVAGWDGTDVQALSTDSSGNLQVDVLTTAGGSTQTDDAAFTPGTSSVSMAGAEFDDTTPDSVDEGDGGAVRMSANRSLYVELRDGADNERAANVDASGNLNVILGANSGVDIGDVDVISSALPTLASTSTLQTTINTTIGNAVTALQIMDDWEDATVTDHAATTVAQATPQTPATVACDDNGNVSFTANANDVSLTIFNSDTTNDVCVRMGATSGADRTDLTTCTFVIAAYSGSGTTEVYETPVGMRLGGESFACDAATTSNLVVTAWRN
jgi:hypothetical protein